MNRSWRHRLLALVAVVIALIPTVPTVRAEPPVVKIVSSLPRVGGAMEESLGIENAIRMALEEAGGQAGGFAVQYEALDDGSLDAGRTDMRKETQNARRAAADPAVVAYIGPFTSGAARSAIPILNRAGLVAVSPTATYPGLTRQVEGGPPNEPAAYYPTGVRSFARVIPSDDRQAMVGANWAKQLGARRVYVLDAGRRRGRTLAAAFATAARQRGLDVVGGPESIDPGAASYYDVAGRIRDAAPDLIYFAGSTQNNAPQLVRDLRAVLGRDVKIMGSDGLYNQAFIDEADEAADGVYVTFNGVPPARLVGRAADWYQAYRARYGAEPGAYSVYGYQAARIILDAIARAGVSDREAIRAAVFATKDFDGVFGRCTFDENGDVNLAWMSGRQVVQGRFDDEGAVVLSEDADVAVVPSPR